MGKIPGDKFPHKKNGVVYTPFGGSYWIRTSDLFHVKEAL
jgi:hypothetical protein